MNQTKELKRIHVALIELAKTLGVQPQYTDAEGKERELTVETALRILNAKGVSIDPALTDSSTHLQVITREDWGCRFTVALPPQGSSPGDLARPLRVTVNTRDEHGNETSFSIPDSDLAVDRDEETGAHLISGTAPPTLGLGAHTAQCRLESSDSAHEFSETWIICPQTAYIPPELERKGIAGVAVALYGLRSERNWGVGDFTDLKVFIDWARSALGAHFVGLNPLHAIFNRHPFNTSPYMPSSRLYRNFIYLDVTAIPDFEASESAQAMVGSPEFKNRLGELREKESVNYEDGAEIKIEALRVIFQAFLEKERSGTLPESRGDRFRAYLDAHGKYLEDFAAFCALEEHFRRQEQPLYSWQDWPEAFQDPDSPEVTEFRDNHDEEILFWKYVQWQIELQLDAAQQYALEKGMILGLYHDEALAVDRNGADAWAMRKYFHLGARVGAPPDPFAPKGQDWGFPPPDRDAIRAACYAPFMTKLRSNCAYGGALRIDHVMQLNRLFWIPEGMEAADGAYVEEREDDLMGLLSLESQRNKALIVGEDLGTVPYGMRDRLMGRRIFSYRVFYFERDYAGEIIPRHAYPEYALVTISTHDLPTLAGFWGETDVVIRRDIGQLDDSQVESFRNERVLHKAKIVSGLVREGLLSENEAQGLVDARFPSREMHMAVLRFALQTPAKLVCVDQADIFLDSRQQNMPGTTFEHPNWVTKMAYTLEELRTDSRAVELAGRFRSALETSGRFY